MSSYTETRIDGVEFFPDKIMKLGLPLAVDDMSLANHLGIRGKTLWWLIHKRKSLYTLFTLPKRGRAGARGGRRSIQNPADSMKAVQKNLLVRFLEPLPMAEHIGAYVLGRSCKDTAAQHVGKSIIISMDIKDFFPSVRQSVIKRFFNEDIGYNYPVASLLAALVTYGNFVPQGAPTSGAIANIIANYTFDQKILNSLRQLDEGWTYTRYSDDIDISHPEKQSEERVQEIIRMVALHLKTGGFRLNTEKTKTEPYYKQQRVLGMVVNEKVNVPRWEFMRVRSLIHNCLMHGFKTQYSRADAKSTISLKSHIRGKLAFFKNVDAVKAQRLKDKFDIACEIYKDSKEDEVQFNADDS